jgi:hypothetical protein
LTFFGHFHTMATTKRVLWRWQRILDHSILEKLPIFEDLEGYMSHPLDRWLGCNTFMTNLLGLFDAKTFSIPCLPSLLTYIAPPCHCLNLCKQWRWNHYLYGLKILCGNGVNKMNLAIKNLGCRKLCWIKTKNLRCCNRRVAQKSTKKKMVYFYQLIFDYMLSSTLFQLHNFIYFERFHVDGLTFQICQTINWFDKCMALSTSSFCADKPCHVMLAISLIWWT